MIYLSGAVRPGIPAMLTPMMGNRVPDDVEWAADTGCFASPERYSDDWYLGWLEARIPFRERCLFATAPDAFGDGARTLELARPVLPRIRALGFPAAIVAQTGMTTDQVPWDDVDVLFVGGPNRWQHSDGCLALIREAQRRGKWVHVGRVAGFARWRWAEAVGADSADGTMLAFDPTGNAERLRRWRERMEREPVLPLW